MNSLIRQLWPTSELLELIANCLVQALAYRSSGFAGCFSNSFVD